MREDKGEFDLVRDLSVASTANDSSPGQVPGSRRDKTESGHDEDLVRVASFTPDSVSFAVVGVCRNPT